MYKYKSKSDAGLGLSKVTFNPSVIVTAGEEDFLKDEDSPLRQKWRSWWGGVVQGHSALYLSKIFHWMLHNNDNKWSLHPVSNHCTMAAICDQNLDVSFFLLLCLDDSVLSHMFAELLVTLHVPFTSEQVMNSAVLSCLQLTQHPDRVS